ncbi:DUF3592 domain-containing protein [Planctomycetota bacterium]|nr:DUF3592 domain-containing protein [Planctomycetota bacterium]
MKKLLNLVIGLVMIVAGAGVTIYLVGDLMNARQAGSFEQVTGSVTSSSIQSLTSKRGRKYQPKMNYIYTVNNKEYRDDKLAFGRDVSFKSQVDAEDWLEENISGNEVVVYYNPNDPEVSVIDKNTPGYIYFIPLITIGVTIAGFAVMFSAFKSKA